MSLKRRNRVSATFSMSSMTDLVFLLLIFFVLASTMSSPNDIKLNLPQSHSKTNTKPVIAKVSIDDLGNYYVALGKERPQRIGGEDLEAYLASVHQQDSTLYVALHADEDIAYKEVVKVLDIVNKHKMKLVIATKNANR